MRSRHYCLFLIMTFLTACSGQLTNSSLQSVGGNGIMYPLTAEEADKVIATAMVSEFPGSSISGVSLPNRGYVVSIAYLLDSHRISATAIPTFGLSSDGTKKAGFAFEVSHAGTMLLTAPPRAQALFNRINLLAAAIKPPLPSSSNGL